MTVLVAICFARAGVRIPRGKPTVAADRAAKVRADVERVRRMIASADRPTGMWTWTPFVAKIGPEAIP